MFSIFKKKKFVADYLEGLTDMHCHVLPGIDDGAKDGSDALKMLKEYVSLGYKGTIATPHIMEDYYNNTSTSIKATLENFILLKNSKGFEDFNITAAAEYMLDTGFNELLEKNDVLKINGNQLLVEFSYFQKPIQADHMLFSLKTQKLAPILAHPERYNYLKDTSEILEFKKRGCLLQLNILSLGGHYGPAAKKKAYSLLQSNDYSYLGTDAHKPAHFTVLKNITIEQKYEPAFESLIETTKQQLLTE